MAYCPICREPMLTEQPHRHARCSCRCHSGGEVRHAVPCCQGGWKRALGNTKTDQ